MKVILRHYGPGIHKSGTPQSVHGRGGMAKWKAEKEKNDIVAQITKLKAMSEDELLKFIQTSAGPYPLIMKANEELSNRRRDRLKAQEEAILHEMEERRKILSKILEEKRAEAEKTGPLVFKSQKQAQQYANEHPGEFGAKQINLAGLTTTQANRVLNHLRELNNKFGISPLNEFTTKTGAAVTHAMASAAYADYWTEGKRIRLRPKAVNSEDASYSGSKLKVSESDAEYIRKNRDYVDAIQKEMRDLEPDSPRYQILRNQLDVVLRVRYDRYNVFTPERVTECIITHEYGHHVMAIAMSSTTMGRRDAYDRWKKTYDKMRDTGEIAKVSQYSADGGLREGFAECFTMYHHGERDKLPKYTIDAIEHMIEIAQEQL